MFETSPSYIKSLLMPNGNNKGGRRVWAIDLETVWLPFFHATNVMGDTALPAEALGAPIRLAVDKDGAVKFGKTGRPITRIVKEVSQTVTLIRENFVANLQNYASEVAEGKAEQYKKSVTEAVKAGKPIMAKDKADLDKAIKAQIEQAVKDAENKQAETSPPEAETPVKDGKKELVTSR